MVGPYTGGRSVENFYLVRERDRRRIREMVVLLVGLAPFALALLGYTWIHLEVRHTGYRIERLERRLVELRNQERRLLLETAYLTSPERLQRDATEILGMRPQSLDDLIFLDRP